MSTSEVYLTSVEVFGYEHAQLPTARGATFAATAQGAHAFACTQKPRGCTIALHGRDRSGATVTCFVRKWRPRLFFVASTQAPVDPGGLARLLTIRVYQGANPPKEFPVAGTSVERRHRSDFHHPSASDVSTPESFDVAALHYASLSAYKKALRYCAKVADGEGEALVVGGTQVQPIQLTVPVEQHLFRRCGIRPNSWVRLPPTATRISDGAKRSLSASEFVFDATEARLDELQPASGPPPPLVMASYDIETDSFRDPTHGGYVFPKPEYEACEIRVIGVVVTTTAPTDWNYDAATGKLHVMRQTKYCITNGGPPPTTVAVDASATASATASAGGDDDNDDKYIHIHCEDEKGLLEAFSTLMREVCPDFLVGYNTNKFDNPYIATRIRHVYGGLALKNSALHEASATAPRYEWACRRACWSFGRIPATCGPPVAIGMRPPPKGAGDGAQKKKRKVPDSTTAAAPPSPSNALIDADEEEEAQMDAQADEEQMQVDVAELEAVEEEELGMGDLDPRSPCRFHTPGVNNFDLMDLLLKDQMAGYESYALDAVASKELGEGKLEIDTREGENGYTAMFRILKTNDDAHGWEQVRSYCVKDCALPIRILLKKNLIDFNCEVASACFTPLSDVLNRGQTCRLWNYYCQTAWRLGYVAVSLPKELRASTFYMSGRYEGAVVLETKPGFYRTPCACVDYASLYPSIIRRYRICHSTTLDVPWDEPLPAQYADRDNIHTVFLREPKTDAVPKAPLIETPVHILQSKDLGIVPAMCEELTQLRKEWKGKLKVASKGSIEAAQASAAEKAVKVLNNSIYGQLGSYRVNPHMGARQLARSVTSMGRTHLLEVADTVRRHGLPIVAGDTDSVMFHMPTAESPEEIQAKGEEIEAEVNATLGHPMKIEMEKVMWPCVYLRRKMYFYRIWEDGSPVPFIKSMGIPTKRRGMIAHFRTTYESIMELMMSHPDEVSVEDVKRGTLKLMHEMVSTIFDAPLYQFEESQKVPVGTPKVKSKGYAAEERRSKAVGQPMRVGERIQFVTRYDPNRKAKRTDLAVELEQFKEAASEGRMTIDLLGALQSYQGRFKTLLSRAMGEEEAIKRYDVMLHRFEVYAATRTDAKLTEAQLVPRPDAPFRPPPPKDERPKAVIRAEWVERWRRESAELKREVAAPVTPRVLLDFNKTKKGGKDKEGGKEKGEKFTFKAEDIVDVAGSFDPDATLKVGTLATSSSITPAQKGITFELQDVERAASEKVDLDNLADAELRKLAHSVLSIDCLELDATRSSTQKYHATHATPAAAELMARVRATEAYKTPFADLKAKLVDALTVEAEIAVLGHARDPAKAAAKAAATAVAAAPRKRAKKAAEEGQATLFGVGFKKTAPVGGA